MEWEQFATEFGKLCMAKQQAIVAGSAEVWWETVNDKKYCLPGLEWAFKQMRLKGEKFMPSVGELIDLAMYEAKRLDDEYRKKHMLPEPEITDEERSQIITELAAAREMLTRKFTMPSAEQIYGIGGEK